MGDIEDPLFVLSLFFDPSLSLLWKGSMSSFGPLKVVFELKFAVEGLLLLL